MMGSIFSAEIITRKVGRVSGAEILRIDAWEERER